MPGAFTRIVPAWVPWPDLMVAMSGVAELAGAAGLMTSRFARSAGWGLILLLVAVFPANVYMLEIARTAHSAAWYQALLWLRLPLQPLLIWWVWRAAVRPRRPAVSEADQRGAA